ncbi:hypothetical protein [Streptomyces sp. MZ04]|uniref:hypothetical protein n=1 Tax=Streptomyces sp. MZ04 TaxID=2559236 RepID=UPI00107E96FD|nr:hypothetical protein [Streptomyces sp. MZ04]TGB09786.1 hypothetical protein E2651_15665 [Streptomyces sp. MZ04]
MESARVWPPFLDWSGPGHWGDDEPCVLCRRPTPLRSDAGKPCHKVCAEEWYEKHPDKWAEICPPETDETRQTRHGCGL